MFDGNGLKDTRGKAGIFQPLRLKPEAFVGKAPNRLNFFGLFFQACLFVDLR